MAASLGVPVLTIGAGSAEYALRRIVAAARAFGLQAVDGPHARLDDDLGLVLSARRALAHGYDGKWVIHPSQIEPVNFTFTPSPADVERAQRILATSGGAERLDGEMVDEAARKLAESLLSRAARAGRLSWQPSAASPPASRGPRGTRGGGARRTPPRADRRP
jgi:citrate lyase subunit beta/citryl-CoA lyase